MTFECETAFGDNKVEMIKSILRVLFWPFDKEESLRRLMLGEKELSWRIANIDNYLKSRY